MCGIVGIVSTKNIFNYISNFKKSIKRIKHRGPNHKAFRIGDNYAIGYVRLAIRGGKNCNQPMCFKNGFAFGNGENYESELKNKNDLIGLVESILNDDDKLFDFDADFALTALDINNQKFYLARDRFGVKPLFYTWVDKDTICFASEVKAILTIINTKRPSPKGILDYLIFGYNLNNRTVYDNIYRFPPKCIFEWDLKSGLKKYKSFDQISKCEKISFNNVLNKSVNSRLIADYKIGSHLSGGLDSTMVAFLANKKQKVMTFTGYRTITDRDFIVAKEFAMLNNFKHKNIFIKSHNNYKQLIRVLDSPIMSSGAFVQFELAKAIHKCRFKVVLEGQGADELLLGYKRFTCVKHIANENEFIDLISNSNIEYMNKLFNINASKLYLEYFNSYKIDLKGMQKFYINNFLQELLKIEDHSNMYCSIENRVPFLSKYFERYGADLTKIGKVDLKEYHDKLKTNINTDLCKINGNIPAHIELNILLKKFKKLLNKDYLILEKENVLSSLKNIDKLTKEEAYSLWILYNVLLWCKINNFRNIVLNEKDLDYENNFFVVK